MTDSNIKISVCIPAYKHPEYLLRALTSLATQQCSNWEVVITDDSPDDSVYQVVQQFRHQLPIQYFKNTPAHGMPANWNTCYDKARGTYIKILHDDDWLAHPQALEKMAAALDNNPDCDFVYTAFSNHYLESGSIEEMRCHPFYRRLLSKSPINLFQRNFIGPPSVIMHRNKPAYRYDVKTRWVVDIDFYMQVLEANRRFVYIDEVLVNVGISGEQITRDCFRVREVEIPENFYLLRKHSVKALNNIYVYDFFWRMLRNLEIRHVSDLRTSGLKGDIPIPVLQMLTLQRQFPLRLLRIGPLSKMLMSFAYLFRKRL
jgi:glycosyltransferase involved in cell wall biosynthesis